MTLWGSIKLVKKNKRINLKSLQKNAVSTFTKKRTYLKNMYLIFIRTVHETERNPSNYCSGGGYNFGIFFSKFGIFFGGDGSPNSLFFNMSQLTLYHIIKTLVFACISMHLYVFFSVCIGTHNISYISDWPADLD